VLVGCVWLSHIYILTVSVYLSQCLLIDRTPLPAIIANESPSRGREDARATRGQHYGAVWVSEFWYRARESRMQRYHSVFNAFSYRYKAQIEFQNGNFLLKQENGIYF